jgi:outer membrane immunogenic protein
MKQLLTAIAALGLIGTPAFAADMVVKAPPAPPPAPVYSWTGWYAGVNAGASFGNVKTDFNVAPVTESNLSGAGVTATTPGVAFSNREYPSGFIGGGQIGYNWQFSPIWVVGLEADFQGALERDSNNLTNPFSCVAPPAACGGPGVGTLSGTAVTNHTTQIDWFGTVRARIGYVWGNGEVMSYLTGGLAYGEVKIGGTNTVSIPPSSVVPSLTSAFGHSQVNIGWTVGYGIEGKLLIPGWTLKAEYLYVDLGTLDAAGSGGSVNFFDIVPFNLAGGQVTTHTHFTDNILRVGLNYQFH